MKIKATRIYIAPPIREELTSISRSTTAEFRAVQRARIILLAAEGHSNAAIARSLGCTEKTARKWRDRFALQSTLAGLQDVDRSGRPAQVPLEVHCELIKLACQRPVDSKVPFRNIWTLNSLRDALAETTAWELSRSEIWRLLKSKGLRPHRVRMWLHSPDPEFSRKATRICQLYRSPPQSARVVCIDEKTGMQALERKYPLHRSHDASIQRLEYEYIRHGTRSLIAALEPATGEVFGYCAPTRKAHDLEVFMNALAKRYPRGDVYVIWDNLNIHHGERWVRFNAENGRRFHFVHTPLHASWMNQIESWFSILQRRVLKYGDFRSADELAASVLKFISYWNRNESHAFQWKWRGPEKPSNRRKVA